MRTNVVYLHRLDPASRLRVILAIRDMTFDRTKIAMHRVRWVRWVRTSQSGGYWTN